MPVSIKQIMIFIFEFTSKSVVKSILGRKNILLSLKNVLKLKICSALCFIYLGLLYDI